MIADCRLPIADCRFQTAGCRTPCRFLNLRSAIGNRQSRSGQAALELLFTLPILLVLLLAMVEFSLLLTARQQLLCASREAARVACQGGDTDEVCATVRRVLGPGRLGDAAVDVRRFREDPRHPTDGRDRVEVRVRVPATHAAPDLLGWVGVSLRNLELVACTVMCRE
jgi:hypothetical protein